MDFNLLLKNCNNSSLLAVVRLPPCKRSVCNLLKAFLLFINVDINKQFQSSDFGGELTSAQLKYCANDVVYLHKIHDELVQKLSLL